MPTTSKSKRNYIYAVGRRKTAVARVRYISKGEGKLEVNGKTVQQYFGKSGLDVIAQAPLQLTSLLNTGEVSVKVTGGGKKAQAESVRMAIARALIKADPELKDGLKKSGYLTRDSRKKERKKPGLKRARRAPQWSKR